MSRPVGSGVPAAPERSTRPTVARPARRDAASFERALRRVAEREEARREAERSGVVPVTPEPAERPVDPVGGSTGREALGDASGAVRRGEAGAQAAADGQQASTGGRGAEPAGGARSGEQPARTTGEGQSAEGAAPKGAQPSGPATGRREVRRPNDVAGLAASAVRLGKAEEPAKAGHAGAIRLAQPVAAATLQEAIEGLLGEAFGKAAGATAAASADLVAAAGASEQSVAAEAWDGIGQLLDALPDAAPEDASKPGTAPAPASNRKTPGHRAGEGSVSGQVEAPPRIAAAGESNGEGGDDAPNPGGSTSGPSTASGSPTGPVAGASQGGEQNPAQVPIAPLAPQGATPSTAGGPPQAGGAAPASFSPMLAATEAAAELWRATSASRASAASREARSERGLSLSELRHPELGRIALTLRGGQQGVEVTAVVRTVAAMLALKESERDLRDRLERQGQRLAAFRVEIGGQGEPAAPVTGKRTTPRRARPTEEEES